MMEERDKVSHEELYGAIIRIGEKVNFIHEDVQELKADVIHDGRNRMKKAESHIDWLRFKVAAGITMVVTLGFVLSMVVGVA